MIRLIYSNQTERLLDALAKILKAQRTDAGTHPLDPVELVVPNRNMEAWVRLGLAEAAGVAANLRFRRLERFIGDLLAETCPGEISLVNLDTVEAAILSVLLDEQALSRPELEPVRRYLESTGPAGGGTVKAAGMAGHAPAGSDRLIGRNHAKESERSAPDAYLAADGADIRRVQLASRMAYLFQEYSYSRPEMIALWRDNGGVKTSSSGYSIIEHPFANPAEADPTLKSTAAWQRTLWLAVFGSGGILEKNPPPEGGRWTTLDCVALDDDLFAKIKHEGLPPVHIFGISYMARLFQHLFARLGESGNLFIYTLNPCAEFWEDVETEREHFYRLDGEIDRRSKRVWKETGETEDDDPFGLFKADTPALRYWGRPGREHVRLLGELTECDFTGAFTGPEEEGLLHRLQMDILRREPERTLREEKPRAGDQNGGRGPADAAPYQPDETIRLVAAPSVRREVEWVADEIWKLMQEDRPEPGRPPFRFSDIAVIVNSTSRDVYLPQIETAFAACHNLPNSVSDLPGTAGSRLIEAINLLLKLPFGRFSRAEMLAFMSHPAVIGRLGDLTAGEIAAKAEQLGIFFGADRSDHAGTYIDEDVYNWDQGIRRLALGAFMTGEKSGDQRIFETAGGRWLVEEVFGAGTQAARFGLLARSLIADARFVCEHKMNLTCWARFYAAQIEAYLHIEDGADERDRLRLLRSLSRLEAMDLGCAVSGRIAAELAGRAIESLGSGRGRYLAEGVVVSSFLPMRAIPFRAVFLLGLGEGLFPATARLDALDLRAARRRAGDVDPAERDRYMFLETLLCTRERLYLSYVRRDEQTGDPLQPSAVVQELMHILKTGYLGEEKTASLRIEPPLRRFEDPSAGGETFFDEARAEVRIREIAQNWQAHAFPDTDKWPAASFKESLAGELDAIRCTAPPEAWEKLAAMLALPGEPPAPVSVRATAAARGVTPEDEGAIEAPLPLSISVLRRFLECPMQGWAAAMLGLAEIEEDLADREEEDFEVDRLTETVFLREVFLDALIMGIDPEELYRERSTRMRLAGELPVGSLGKALQKRHYELFAGWRSLLEQVPAETGSSAEQAGLPGSLHRVRLGRSSRLCTVEKALDPLSLNIGLSGKILNKLVIPVRISGLSEALATEKPLSIIFQPKKPPSGKGKGAVTSSFRPFLRGLTDQALLAAAGILGAGERQILVCYAAGTEDTALYRMRLRPADREKALGWLTRLAEDLLGGSHAYLLPCEAIITAYYEQIITLVTRSSGSILPPLPDNATVEFLLNGEKIRALVKQMAEDEWLRFSSLWGPVPSPRNYEPPPAAEAGRLASRRFGPLFEDIIALEVLS